MKTNFPQPSKGVFIMSQQYKSFTGTAKQMREAGVTVNGSAVDAVGLSIMHRYGVAKVVGKAEKGKHVRGRAGAIYHLQGKSGFNVEFSTVKTETKELEFSTVKTETKELESAS
ncbi:MAG: hypothetical protein LC100_15315 [Chitinophagales bacterium]|nr:hypothetical protein [Chitinophagales bacterium]